MKLYFHCGPFIHSFHSFKAYEKNKFSKKISNFEITEKEIPGI